jgi:hypothetical protein
VRAPHDPLSLHDLPRGRRGRRIGGKAGDRRGARQGWTAGNRARSDLGAATGPELSPCHDAEELRIGAQSIELHYAGVESTATMDGWSRGQRDLNAPPPPHHRCRRRASTPARRKRQRAQENGRRLGHRWARGECQRSHAERC